MHVSSWAVALSLLAIPSLAVEETDVVFDGVVVAESVSIEGYLDAPKLSSVTANQTSYDWWYFDAVSASTDSSVTVVFYDTGPEGFLNGNPAGPYSVGLSGSFPNGSLWTLNIESTDGVSIDTSSDGGISGEWKGSDNAAFTGVGLLDYVITIDAPGIGVSGSIVFTSIAPAHYPCGSNLGGSDEFMIPHVFWANAVPDAIAVVSLTVGDTELSFADGVGYHDKNWGDSPFIQAVSSWYWGHARVGPYSIVWFDAIDSAGSEYMSGYVAEAGSILEASCSVDSVIVRPWGANSEYPPLATTGIMEGVEAIFQLGNGLTLTANITTGLAVISQGIYVRTLGTVDASVSSGETYTGGRALFEEFKFLF